MNYWMEYEIRRIACDPPAYPDHAIESWPASPTTTDDGWRKTTQRFCELLDRLARLANSDSETLAQIVPTHPNKTDPSKPTRPLSVEDVVSQIAAHNSYHLGQIALLRRQMNAWPPAPAATAGRWLVVAQFGVRKVLTTKDTKVHEGIVPAFLRVTSCPLWFLILVHVKLSHHQMVSLHLRSAPKC